MRTRWAERAGRGMMRASMLTLVVMLITWLLLATLAWSWVVTAARADRADARRLRRKGRH